MPLPTPVILLGPILAIAAGFAVYWDARTRDREPEIAALLGFVIAGLFLAGTIPSLVALAIAEDVTAQGFPTAIRIIPGVAAVLIYLIFR